MNVRIALAGAGAFGEKHLDALGQIDGVSIASIVSGNKAEAAAAAQHYGVGHSSDRLDEILEREDVDAVILCTPTPLHAEQALACLKAGKHVQVEIPLADSIEGAERVLRAQQDRDLVCMVGHTRRFNPSHQWVHRRVEAGEFQLRQLNVQTYFYRRTNINAKGEARSWTDHLLWHHAAHSIDLFAYQSGPVTEAHILQGPRNATLGIAMDMAIHLKSVTGALCTISLSFNNDGPLGTVFRYIGDTGTYVANYDSLVDGHGRAIDLSASGASTNGIELQDREFVAAIREKREPEASAARVFGCYQVIDDLAKQLEQQDGWS